MKKIFQGRKHLPHESRHIRFVNKGPACRKPLQTGDKLLHSTQLLSGHQIYLCSIKIHMIANACHTVYRHKFQR